MLSSNHDNVFPFQSITFETLWYVRLYGFLFSIKSSILRNYRFVDEVTGSKSKSSLWSSSREQVFSFFSTTSFMLSVLFDVANVSDGGLSLRFTCYYAGTSLDADISIFRPLTSLAPLALSYDTLSMHCSSFLLSCFRPWWFFDVTIYHAIVYFITVRLF